MGLVLSPFAGFAIHGKVAAPGLAIGLIFALLPLSGLVAMAILRWRAWRRLPPHVVEEWNSGRVVPAEGAPGPVSPLRFFNDKHWIEMQLDGVTISRHCLLSMQGVSELMAKSWIAEQTGQLFIPWRDILEWVVDTDSDGPDCYQLKLESGGILKIRRFQPEAASECDLLDAVRSLGHVPVRLCCDVECR